jgi:diguanylate cyclase
LTEAEQVAERIRQSIQAYSFKPLKIFVTVSIGIAMYPLDANSLDELIEKSDSSLYQAKRDGKNRVIVYSKNKNCIKKNTEYYTKSVKKIEK